MLHWDTTGLVAAFAAVVLAAGAWMMDPPDSGATGDEVEMASLDRAASYALESTAIGQPFVWQSRQGASHATIIPASAYRDTKGRWCRSYSLAFVRPDQPGARKSMVQVACRDASGQWSREQAADEQVAGH